MKQGPPFTKDQSKEVRIEPALALLEQNLKKEIADAKRKEQEQARLKSLKKSKLEQFNDILYTQEQLYRLGQNILPHIKSDFTDQVQKYFIEHTEL